MSWRQTIPIGLTLCAMLAGFFSLLATAAGDYYRAAQLIMLSMLLDGLDGTLARLFKGVTKFGADLDTYVDMTSFGLAPAFLAYELVLKEADFWGLALTSGIVLSGVLRLSRFRIGDPHRGQRGFLGLPITANAGWIALFVLVTQSGVVSEDALSLHHGPTAAFIWAAVCAMILLQVSHLHYSKPTKGPKGMLPGVLLIAALFLPPRWAVAAALTLCLIDFVYAFVTPFLYRRASLAVAYEEDRREGSVNFPR